MTEDLTQPTPLTQPRSVSFSIESQIGSETLQHEVVSVLTENPAAFNFENLQMLNAIHEREALTEFFDKLVNDKVKVVYPNTDIMDTISTISLIEKTDTHYRLRFNALDNPLLIDEVKQRSQFQLFADKMDEIINQSDKGDIRYHKGEMETKFDPLYVLNNVLLENSINLYPNGASVDVGSMIIPYIYVLTYYVKSKNAYAYSALSSTIPLEFNEEALDGVMKVSNHLFENPYRESKEQVVITSFEYTSYAKFLKATSKLRKHRETLQFLVKTLQSPSSSDSDTNDNDETIKLNTWWVGGQNNQYDIRLLEHSLVYHKKPYLVVRGVNDEHIYAYINHTLTVEEATHLENHFSGQLSIATIKQHDVALNEVEGDGIYIHAPQITVKEVVEFINERIVNKKAELILTD